MVNRIPDATGWISESGQTVAHGITAHACIALLAILVIALLLGQLARRPGEDAGVDGEDWD